jgi:hypothetical protein
MSKNPSENQDGPEIATRNPWISSKLQRRLLQCKRIYKLVRVKLKGVVVQPMISAYTKR